MKHKLAATVGLAVVLVVGLAAPASAHVVVEPSTAPKGAEQTFVFRVPNEIDSSSTIELDVKFPTATPITGVAVEPVPGWTSHVTSVTLKTPIQTDDGPVDQVVSEISWTGGKITKGEFQRFPWVGTLPDDVSTLVFPAIQTYANGTVVSWIQPIVPGQPAPDHPTPTITLTSATGSTAAQATTVPAASSTGSAGTAATASASSVKTAKTLGLVGLIAGLVGLVLGGFALARTRGRDDRRWLIGLRGGLRRCA